MNKEEFKKELENSSDRLLTIKTNASELKFTMQEFIDIVNDVLNDNEKVKFLDNYGKGISPYFLNSVIKSIDSDKIKIETIRNNNFSENLPEYYIPKIIKTLSDDSKLEILNDKEYLTSKKISINDIAKIIISMSDDAKRQFLDNPEMKKGIDLKEYDYTRIISSIKNDEISLDYAEKFELSEYNTAVVVSSCSDSKKKEVILLQKYQFSGYNTEVILSNFNDVSELLDFMNENKDLFDAKKIHLHNLIGNMPKEKQIELITQMDDRVEDTEQLKCLVMLSKEAKAEIDRTNMSERFREVLDINIIEDLGRADLGYIDIDLDGDLSKYKDLDELISIMPQNIPDDKYDRIYELMDICPKLGVRDRLRLIDSTVEEFKNGESWIKSVLENIHEDWSDIQKLAYIDNCIGKRTSYTPDFDTEVCKDASARALWRIIDSGYGICNGISQVEQYMLQKVGIESELISAGNHAYLKIKNIEIPRADGTVVTGNTLVDPTWNLAAHRYGGYPNLFAKGYEEIRKFDISRDGTDRQAHKNDELSKEDTIEMEESVLRDIYKSLGLAKEDGYFPIGDMIDKSAEIAKRDEPLKKKIEQELELVSSMHPDFSRCQNSTIEIVAGSILSHPEIKYNKLIVKRAYNRQDEEQRPSIFVYYNDENQNEGFFVAEPGAESFSFMDKEEFTKCYECYEKDIKKFGGKRPWEKEAKEPEKDLNQSSGTITNEEHTEGDER